ncbi:MULTISPECIES: NADPH:quinone reductase [unclassified Curtobacterium]|uniref:NADPH:quinone reductase n=1 Tax=unclassified Curtobacterium TaxID=257496 RepID=UPI000DAA6961|nr:MULTISPECIES: NADPH:quinone reductase [unclassified Curtobacterium]PZE36533.1 NADPH:quinone reductase [Curtobacterium sp. MCPF17_031]PZF10674.1 NADPH:quinone reductase [Curtobacterium sp. MCPF17_011]
MRSIVYSQPGTSSVLSLADRPVPEPGDGEVRVRVVVSGVNPTDWKARQGGTYGDGLPFPEITPNQDGAGIVDAVGTGVEGVSVGDRVWVFLAAASRPTGTAQEYTVLPATRVAPLPDGVSFDVGASLGIPAMTAHRALTLHEDGPSRLSPGALSGRTVLVAGGAGAVGHAAIQLARWAGATVIATVSSDAKAGLATAAGAHHTVNYREDGAADRIRSIAPDGVDIVVEVAIPANAELDAAVLANHGLVAMYADNGGDAASIQVRPNMGINARYQFLLVYTIGEAALAAGAEDVTAALRDGVLPVGEDVGLPLVRFPLEETAAAHDAVQGDTVGKVLVDVQAE